MKIKFKFIFPLLSFISAFGIVGTTVGISTKLIQNNDMLQNGNKNENNNGNEDNSENGNGSGEGNESSNGNGSGNGNNNGSGNQDNNDNSNVKYGYAISGVDPITQREFTNEATPINQVINNSNEFIKNKLTKSLLDEALNIFVKNYADNVKNMRDSQLEYSIEEFNTKLNTDKTLTGNIKIKFTFIGSVTSAVSNQNRESGDVEIHNFVFENSKIESYVNTVTSNFVSFKITTKHLQKQFIFKNPDNYKKNTNVGILNEIIYLDSFNKFTLQLNNSPFTLNYNNFLENNYLYNFSNKDEKEAFKEIISTITRGKGKLKVFGKDPSRPTLNLSSPVYYITLSKQYNLSTSFASNITWTLASMHNFFSPLKQCYIIDNNIYFDTDALIGSLNKNDPNKVIDLNTNQPYGNFIDMITNDIFSYERKIKQTFIDTYQKEIGNDWNKYLSNLTERQKAEKIYSWFLPLVSYGMLNGKPSQIGGLLNKKVICQGYASLFTHLANVVGLSSLTITGLVGSGAVPGQTESTGLHAWNLVKINGTWLWADPTWDDSFLPTSPNYNRDNFLIETSSFFSKTKHINATNWNDGKDLPISIPNLY